MRLGVAGEEAARLGAPRGRFPGSRCTKQHKELPGIVIVCRFGSLIGRVDWIEVLTVVMICTPTIGAGGVGRCGVRNDRYYSDSCEPGAA